VEQDEQDRDRTEALIVEWASWLTDAAHRWDSREIHDKFRTSVCKGCEWIGTYSQRVQSEGIFEVCFGVPANIIREDVPGVDLKKIVELINTEPGGEIGAHLEVDGHNQEFLVLSRYHYIPTELRDNWLESGAVPQSEVEIIRWFEEAIGKHDSA
jgi:hypothetical protein